MNDLLRSYLHYLALEKNASKNTIASYTLDLTRYLRVLEEVHVTNADEITTSQVSNYLALLRRIGLSARSVSRNLSSVRMFHKFLLVPNFDAKFLSFFEFVAGIFTDDYKIRSFCDIRLATSA